MTDIVDATRRSAMMAGIRSKNTKPELIVRSIAHRMGLRYRLHLRALPGTPDLVFPKHNIVIFVHGCFWHRHEGCKFAYVPKTRRSFWNKKFAANVVRDTRDKALLQKLGWKVIKIWECESRKPANIASKLKKIFR